MDGLTHDDSIYHNSIASRSRNITSSLVAKALLSKINQLTCNPLLTMINLQPYQVPVNNGKNWPDEMKDVSADDEGCSGTVLFIGPVPAAGGNNDEWLTAGGEKVDCMNGSDVGWGRTSATLPGDCDVVPPACSGFGKMTGSGWDDPNNSSSRADVFYARTTTQS